MAKLINDKIENKSDNMWCLSLSLFKKQINFIKKNTIKKIYKSETLLTEIPSHGLSITFDDGYLDTYKISYPHGKFNIKIKQKVFDSGYKLAFSSKFGVNKKNQDKLALNRSEIWSTDEIEIFNEKLEGNWDWLRFRNL